MNTTHIKNLFKCGNFYESLIISKLHYLILVCANGKGIVKSPKKKSGQKMKISHLYRTSMLKPFRLIIGYEFFSHCAMLSSIRSYMVEVFNTLNMPVEPQWLVVSHI